MMFALICLLLAVNVRIGAPSKVTITAFSGHKVRLPCNVINDDFKLSTWIMPDTSLIHHAFATPTISIPTTIDHQGGLLIEEARQSYSGHYTCVAVGPESERRAAIVDLVVRNVSYMPLSWEEQKERLTKGIILAAVGLAIMCGMCLLYKLRWKPKKNKKEQGASIDVEGNETGGKDEKSRVEPVPVLCYANESFSKSQSLEDEEGHVVTEAAGERPAPETSKLKPTQNEEEQEEDGAIETHKL